MFDLGWTELLLIGVVALIVVGPKDLPVLFRQVGRFVGKAKGMAREFTSAMNEAADQAGVKDATDTLNDLRNVTSPKNLGLDALKDSVESAKKWEPGSETEKLAEDRAEAARKIHAATAKKAADRLEAEAKAAAETAKAETAPKLKAKTAADKAPAKKAPAKNTAEKKPTAKKAAPKKAAPKKAPVKKKAAEDKA